MNEIKLDRRLGTLASWVRPGAVYADIGTDHGFLPAYLVEKGILRRAYACDIAKLPLKKAGETVRALGLEDKITLRLTDGLMGLENEGITDISVAGMGGELIAQILSKADFIRSPSVRLLLQPMTRPNILRKWLAGNGFAVLDEALVEEDKLYQMLLCEYDGKPYEITEAEAAVGICNLKNKSPLLPVHLSRLAEVYQTRLVGKKRAGGDTSEEEEILSAIEMWKKEF